MNDLEVAKQRLREEKLSLIFVKNSQVLSETDEEGLCGFLKIVNSTRMRAGHILAGSSVADKVMGKAAALLCIYANVASVYAVTLSRGGLNTLTTRRIHLEYENLIPRILNLNKRGECPFERLVENIQDPEAAFEKIRRFCSQTHAC